MTYQSSGATHSRHVGQVPTLRSDADLITDIRETYRERVDFMREENALILRIKARLRRLLGYTGRKLTRTELAHVNALYRAMLGHLDDDTLSRRAEQDALDQVTIDDHSSGVEQEEDDDDDHSSAATHVEAVAELALQAFVLNEPFIRAREEMHRHRYDKEKRLTLLAKQLPVWPWVEGINGFGPLGLAIIVGIAGDLSNYANPAKLWKRMGLAVIDGRAQRKVLDPEKTKEQGYSPLRRSAMWTIGDSLLKKQNSYRALYLDRKVYEAEKGHPASDSHIITALPDDEGHSMVDDQASHALTKIHIHRRAQRYVEKRLLRDLWTAWRRWWA